MMEDSGSQEKSGVGSGALIGLIVGSGMLGYGVSYREDIAINITIIITIISS